MPNYGGPTPEIIKEVCDLISEGHNITNVCLASGIGRKTYYRWLKRGENEKEGLHREFFVATHEAEAQSKIYLLDKIKEIGAQTRKWVAFAWILERRWPEEFSLRDRISLTTEDSKRQIVQMIKDGVVTVEEVEMTFGKDLASELFERAGHAIVGTERPSNEGRQQGDNQVHKVSG